MKTIYKSIALEAALLSVTLALQAEIQSEGETVTADVQASTLDRLKVTLVSPNVSGERDLVASGNATIGGNEIAVNLENLAFGTHRLVVSARFGTQVRTLYALDISVPQATLPNETQEYEDAVIVVSTYGDGADKPVILVENVTHAQLIAKKSAGELVRGRLYRITDFVTTVANKDNARSAGHAFDILVRALDGSTLDENARAVRHDGDTYFADCNLAAWELKYSLENDAERFSWADETNGKGVIWFMRDEWNNSAFYDFKNVQFKRWAVNEIRDANGDTLDDPTSAFAYDEGTQDIRYGYQGENYTNGKYTFIVGDSEDFDWYYAFTWINEDKEVEDATIVGWTLLSDEGYSYGVHDNKRGACFVGNSEISEVLMRDLDNGVEAATYTYEEGLFYGMYGMETGNDCNYWTCGNNCDYWTCGNDCNYWTCGNNCYYWTCGNDCNYWTCGNDCNYWTCGNDCNYWTCGNECYSWKCGNESSYWTCGNHYRYFAIESGVMYIDISCAVTTSLNAYAQNILIHSGVKGTDNSHATCEIETINNNFLTEFGTVVQGTIS